MVGIYFSGFEHGFKMIVPENANSTFDNAFMTGEQSYKYYNELMWKGRYAECVSVEEASNPGIVFTQTQIPH